MENENKIIIIGAGPAGLAVAYYMLKNTDLKPIVIEESSYIGGISRTHKYNGNRMDLGGHRFFTKNEEVKKFWQEIFPIQQQPSIDDIILDRTEKFSDSGANPEVTDEIFLLRNRLSRIYFNSKFFDYPISLNMDTIKNLGFVNLVNIGIGYIFSSVKGMIEEKRREEKRREEKRREEKRREEKRREEGFLRGFLYSQIWQATVQNVF